MRVYDYVYWDISGVCNSNCSYCCNGRKSLSGRIHRDLAGFLQPREFESAIVFLMEKSVIVPDQTRIELYNWGEPFMHPKFEDMIKIVANKGFKIGLCTNASMLKKIPSDAVPMIADIRFSMPGFSQKSYDRMHGFEFEIICRNIRAITEQIRIIYSEAPISVVFHSYEFNRSEVAMVREFCDSLKIDFTNLYGYLNGFTMAKDYFTDVVSKEDCKKITNELLLEQLEAIRQNRPAGYQCPQDSILVLDEFCNVLQCCGTDRRVSGHVIGKLTDIDFEQLPNIRKNAATCLFCSNLKIDYMWHNSCV